MSLRSGQPVGSQWRTVNSQGRAAVFGKGESIAARDAMETRIPRMLLGGGAGMQLAKPMEYDMTESYGAQTWVHVGANNDAVTSGTIDPNTDEQVNSTPGWYCSGPNGVPLTTANGSPAYYIPQWPLPNTANIDSGQNFWVIFVPDDGPFEVDFWSQAGPNSGGWPKGSMAQVTEAATIGGVAVTPGTYIAMVKVPAGGTGNQLPQYPYPTSGTIYWMMIGLGPQTFGTCENGTQQIYVSASAPLQ